MSKPDNLFTPERHYAYLRDFIKYVSLVGGATPHLTMIGATASQHPFDRRIFLGGCYAATYNYPAAEVIWNVWEEPSYVLRNQEGFRRWIASHFAALPLRRERKAVNNRQRLADCIISFCQWSERLNMECWATTTADPRARYEQAWVSFNEVRYMGRYIAIRFLEFLNRYTMIKLTMPDIRPAGATYPRQALGLLYPEYEAALNGNDSVQNLATANRCAANVVMRLAGDGIVVDYYTLQSLICEYKQSAQGGRQYPGRSLDSELGYWRKVYESQDFRALGSKSDMWRARAESFPRESLGEIQGWAASRDDLGQVLRKHQYTWSDMLYDYQLSRNNLARPITRRSSGAMFDNQEPEREVA